MGPKTLSARCRARPLEQPERKAVLLQTAIRVFARRGLGGARHTEIAREAGVSVPTVFFYFPTREALVHDVLTEVAGFYEDMTERIHSSDRPAPKSYWPGRGHSAIRSPPIPTTPVSCSNGARQSGLSSGRCTCGFRSGWWESSPTRSGAGER